MRSIFAVSVVAAAFAFTGCAVQSEGTTDDESAVGEADEALTAYGRSLIGAWSKVDGDVEVDAVVLRANGTFIWHHDIKCITTPCLTREEGKFIAYKPAAGTVQGRVRLIGTSKEFGTRQYVVVKGYDGTIKLARSGATGKFENVQNWCQAASDCAGQIQTMAVKCAGGYKAVDVCTETNSCGKTCEPITPVAKCVVSGCSGQICAESSMVSTCEWREEYACYKTAICERGTDGKCGWRQTTELTSCLASGGTTCDHFADPTKRYVGKSTEECMLIKFMCEEGTHMFSDSCGCGCEND